MGISANIKNIRKKLGLSQMELAEKTGLSIATIQGYEQNKYNPKINALTKLCVALDCKITDLVDEDSKKYYRMFDNENTKENAPRLFDPKTGEVVPFGTPVKFTAPSTTFAPQEVYELLQLLINKEGINDREREEVSQQLKKILGSFKSLNEIGRKKAVERIEELYMIPKYIYNNFPDTIDEPPQE